jgi:hypothetical protein
LNQRSSRPFIVRKCRQTTQTISTPEHRIVRQALLVAVLVAILAALMSGRL